MVSSGLSDLFSTKRERMAVKLCFNFCKSRSLWSLWFLTAETPVKMEGKYWVAVLKSSLSVQLTSWPSVFSITGPLHSYLFWKVLWCFLLCMKIFFIYEMGLEFFQYFQYHHLVHPPSADLSFSDLFSGRSKVALLSFPRIHQKVCTQWWWLPDLHVSNNF